MMMAKFRTFLVGSTVVTMAAMVTLTGCGNMGTGKAAAAKKPAVTVAVVAVGRNAVTRSIQLLGTLEGEQQANAMPKFAGRVTEIVKREGSYVSAGDPIVSMVNDVPGMDYRPGPVVAPISGVVGKVYVQVGQAVSPAMPVAVVSNYASRIKVRAAVSDADLPYVRTGARAQVMVSAIPDRVFSGAVSQVTPMLDPMTRSATVEVLVPNSSRLLVPGMSASLKLTAEERRDVVAVPAAALFTDGNNRVVVVANGVARFRDIQTGLVGEELVEVVSGLEPGELVATTGKENVKDGEAVNPVEVSQ
jgi:membrane fusion protein (multidrug efflux system)